MAKTSLNDLSETAVDNSDINNINVQGSAKVSNMDDGLRNMAVLIAKAVHGTTPIDDTWRYRNTTDTTKTAGLKTENQATGTERLLDAEALYRNGAPTITRYTSGSNTHTYQAKTRYFMVFGIGGGGGGGGIDGAGAGTGGSASGGNSGFWGYTGILAKNAITTATIVVGAGGAGAVAGANNGTDGGNTTYSDGTNSFTWPGGAGGIGGTASGNFRPFIPVSNADPTGTLYGSYKQGHAGQTSDVWAVAVPGGETPYGTSYYAGAVTANSLAGIDGWGKGTGGGGGCTADVGTNVAGGAGSAGYVEVWEW